MNEVYIIIEVQELLLAVGVERATYFEVGSLLSSESKMSKEGFLNEHIT